MAATETGQIEGVRIRECQGRADGMSVMRWDHDGGRVGPNELLGG
jgi:hypothetical protein